MPKDKIISKNYSDKFYIFLQLLFLCVLALGTHGDSGLGSLTGCLDLAGTLKLFCHCDSLFCLLLLFKLQHFGMLTSFFQVYYIFYSLDWHSVKFPAGDTSSGIMNHVIQTACNYKRINGNARMLEEIEHLSPAFSPALTYAQQNKMEKRLQWVFHVSRIQYSLPFSLQELKGCGLFLSCQWDLNQACQGKKGI